jgi:hypothetical protein
LGFNQDILISLAGEIPDMAPPSSIATWQSQPEDHPAVKVAGTLNWVSIWEEASASITNTYVYRKQVLTGRSNC